ncbi:hypothetical protein EVAR_92974_1 [Eumeta japonica]|uniref:Uncharacterized protein n=1 Tax=Eumeta variegata TaxID=151549 RepID=A0A4C1TBI7_EUMVA|nr:hypothetical protein EVAR_92974_1 [Eumeta japonica]
MINEPPPQMAGLYSDARRLRDAYAQNDVILRGRRARAKPESFVLVFCIERGANAPRDAEDDGLDRAVVTEKRNTSQPTGRYTFEVH